MWFSVNCTLSVVHHGVCMKSIINSGFSGMIAGLVVLGYLILVDNMTINNDIIVKPEVTRIAINNPSEIITRIEVDSRQCIDSIVKVIHTIPCVGSQIALNQWKDAKK